MSTSAGPAAGNTRWLAALALLLVFVAGAGTGWGVGSRFGRGFGPGRWGGPRNGMLLDGGPIDRYGLDAAQRTRIDSVLVARRGQIDAFWRGPGQSLRAILDSTRADVRAVLTPEQRARFDAAHAEHERRMRGRFGPGGGPGPMGGGRPGGPGGGPGGPPGGPSS
ncbi:hypothetical protein tb265_18700 [Gemmatimonadetes bacterium T265]|nr:hypothetical protein tb265_18700 [Gemmatimonadetes bacterium T265]